VSGTATIHTCDAGTDFDTVLYVVPGTDCLNLNRIGCDDNGCTRSSATSRLSFPVTAGDSYLIVVDGYGASGNFALTVTPPPTTTTTRSKCTSKELAVGAKNARAKLKCYSTGVSNGVAVESTCLAQADDKFAASYDRAIEVQDCLNGTDAVTVGDEVDTFLDDVLGSLTGGSTARSRCTAKELTAAGKKVVRTVTCHSQALRKGLPVDPGCLARAEMRYSESFARAMNRGDCLSETDATTLRSIVDSFVNELRDALVP
jgi:hypothetical protein